MIACFRVRVGNGFEEKNRQRMTTKANEKKNHWQRRTFTGAMRAQKQEKVVKLIKRSLKKMTRFASAVEAVSLLSFRLTVA